jgi:N-methylhydantoinase A
VGFLVGTDVGGTFTDLWVAADSGDTRVFKSPTTDDLLGGVLDAMMLAADSHGLSFEQFCGRIERFGHGTTVGLNALLTGSAAQTAVLATEGFGDTLAIGRLKRQTSGMNELERTDAYLRNRIAPLVARDLVIEIDERIDANGKVIRELNEAQARTGIRKLKDRGIEAVAICTLWSTQNPSHERRLRDLVVQELTGVFISMSHEISPGVGEYARMSTTAANAAIGPLAGRYLSGLEARLRQAGMKTPVLMMTCAGGVLPTAVLSERPAYALFSGPAGGVMGSRATGAQAGFDNIVTMDIGGTSFDVGVIVSGKPIMRSEMSVAGADIRVHSIDVQSIGAGGGSIAYVEFGELRVGPRSAGANPGPACYGRGGTRPTATDADLMLGVLDPDNFIGGRMKLDVAAARRAIDAHVAQPLGMSMVEAAWSIRQILDSRMADLLRRMTIERGYDPRDFTLLANGGAGPSHAWVLCEELGLDRFIVPAAATAESAYGTGNSDLGFSAERPAYARVSPGAVPNAEQLARMAAALASASQEVRDNLALAGRKGAVAREQLVAIKFRGQTNHLDIPFRGDSFTSDTFHAVTRAFEAQYETLFGRGTAFANAGYELIAVRVMGTGALSAPAPAARGESFEPAGKRPVVFRDPQAPVETAIYRTSFPKDGESVQGPAIIEFPGQSVVVPPGASAKSDRFGNIHVRLVS